ncbi:MAG TPA: ABC transporter substrate-binding protein, partial [Caproicibacter sp.]|nr:ABC transporter substrate-binding protein [Caproicibacter sp.]
MIKKLTACVLSLALAASFAGCQSGSAGAASAGGTASGAANSTAAASGDTIKIGVVTPLTGQTSSFGQSAKKGLELLEEQTNNAGGINGKKIQFLIQDDEGKAASAVTVGQKLINSDKVVAIVGPLTSTCANSLAPICQ